MLTKFRNHLAVFLAATLGVVIGSVGPGVARAAYDAVNAQKVDGFSAIGSGASAGMRAGKLVAANTKGRAPDAERLNGFAHEKLRHISIPIQSVGVESGATQGPTIVLMQDTGTPALTTSFLLPPDYKAGNPIYLDMLFEAQTGFNCTLYLFADGLTGRVGDFIVNSGWRAPNWTTYFGTVPVSTNASQARKVTFRSQTSAVPGQLLSFHLTRAGQNGSDTCTGQLAVYGLQVRY